MKESISYKKIWLIAYPIILGSIAQNIINVTDTAFLGRVGEVALGAGAIAGIFYLSLVTLAWGFGMGLQIIVARRYGEENFPQIGRVIDHGIYFLMGISVLVFLLYQFFGENFFRKVLDSEVITEESLKYIQVRIYGVFFAFINVAFRAFYVGIGKTKIISYTTLLMAFVNVGLDYILIFGHFGFKEYGITGAAIASLVAEAAALVYFIIYTFRRNYPKAYNLFYFKKFDKEIFNRVVKISSPTMIQSFVSIFGWFIFFLFVERMGERPLAISNISRSLYVVLMIPIMGFASASNTLVSYIIGKGQTKDVMKVIWRVSLLCVSSVLIIVSVGMIFPEQLIGLYSDDIGLIKDTVKTYYVISGSAITISIAFVLFQGVSGTGKTNVSLFIELIIIVIYLMATYIITHIENVQIHQVWYVEYMYAFFLALFSFLYLKFGKWKGSEV